MQTMMRLTMTMCVRVGRASPRWMAHACLQHHVVHARLWLRRQA